MSASDLRFWCRWAMVNAIAETVGLGGAFVVGLGAAFRPAESTGAILVGLALSPATVEGIIVGIAQWLVLRGRLPALSLWKWALATAASAVAVWSLGTLPGASVGLSAPDSSPASFAPGYQTLLIAVALGAVAGITTGLAQWLVLRRHVARAWLWLPANAAAWMAAMIVVVAGAALIPPDASLTSLSLAILGIVAVAGIAVGAIHGYALVAWLLPRRPLPAEPGGA